MGWCFCQLCHQIIQLCVFFRFLGVFLYLCQNAKYPIVKKYCCVVVNKFLYFIENGDFGKYQDFLKKNVIPQEILKIFVISQEVDAKNSKKHPGNVTFVEMPPGYWCYFWRFCPKNRTQIFNKFLEKFSKKIKLKSCKINIHKWNSINILVYIIYVNSIVFILLILFLYY